MITHRSSLTPLETETRCGLSRSLTGFTLIELLIVIAVIAILAVAVILVLNPVELLREGRDATRLSDMNTLNQSILLYQEDVGGSLGAASTTYFSIPDPAATSTLGDHCEGLGLSAPSGWSYHCAASSTVKNVDGTGWMPINFKQISFGHPIGALPVDPTNTTSSGLYYTYVAGSYALTAAMESQKYLTKAQNDGGYDPSRYETGSDLALVAKSEGLVGWWKFDEGSGSTAHDSSGNGNDGTWSGTGTHWVTGKVGAYAGQMAASAGDYVSIGNPPTIKQSFNAVTLMGWAYVNSSQTGSATLFGETGYNFNVQYYTPNNLFYYYINNGGNNVYFSPSGYLGAWHHFALVFDGIKIYAYIDGALVTSGNSSSGNTGSTFTGSFVIGNSFNGMTDDVRFYSRALSPAEIQNIYNAEK